MKTRKQIIAAAFLSLFIIGLSGCGKNFDELACRETVAKEVGTYDVVNLSGKKYEFIARDSTDCIWIIKTYGNWNEITDKVKIMGAR
jgi:hypothetical protein